MNEVHVTIPDWWQIPALLLAIAGFITLIVKWFMVLGRKDKTLEDHEKTQKEHAAILKACAEKKVVTEGTCRATQQVCINHQLELNDNIIQVLEELKKEVKDTKAIDTIWTEIKENRRQAQDELIKITRSVGRIEGIVHRFRFDDKEDLK